MTYCDDTLYIMYANIKLLCFELETNIMLHNNFALKRK